MREIGLDLGGIFSRAALSVDRKLDPVVDALPAPVQEKARRAADGFVAQVGQLAGYVELAGFRWPVKPYAEKLSDGVTRGSRLTAADYPELKEKGYRSLVDLCAEGSLDETHGPKSGFQVLNLRIIDNGAPSMEQATQFLDFVTAPQNQPAYFHCEAGMGRTGVMAAVYRIAAQGWSVEDAVQEAMDHGMALPNQLGFIQDFAKALEAGKVSGYPLSPPVAD